MTTVGEWNEDSVLKRCQSANDAVAGSEMESAEKVLSPGPMLPFHRAVGILQLPRAVAGLDGHGLLYT